MLRRGEIFERDAQVLPAEVAARVDEVAQEETGRSTGTELREASQGRLRWEEIH